MLSRFSRVLEMLVGLAHLKKKREAAVMMQDLLRTVNDDYYAMCMKTLTEPRTLASDL